MRGCEDPVVVKMRRIDIDDDEVGIGFDHRLLYAEEPYTGGAEDYLAGHLVSRVTCTRNGVRVRRVQALASERCPC